MSETEFAAGYYTVLQPQLAPSGNSLLTHGSSLAGALTPLLARLSYTRAAAPRYYSSLLLYLLAFRILLMLLFLHSDSQSAPWNNPTLTLLRHVSSLAAALHTTAFPHCCTYALLLY